MAWTTPKTWSVGETLTASNFNTHIRDNLIETWHRIARKTADESVTSSTVLQTDDHLTFSVATNEVWALRWMILFNAPTAADFKFAYSFPSGTTYSYSVRTLAAVIDNTTTTVHTATDNTPIVADGEGGVRLLAWDTYFVNGGTGGTFALRWAQSTSNGTPTTLLANSILLGMKVA